MEMDMQAVFENTWGKNKYQHLCQIAEQAKLRGFFADSCISSNNAKHNEEGWNRAYKDKLWFIREFPKGKPFNSIELRKIAEDNAWIKYNKLIKSKSPNEVNFSTIMSNEKKRILRWQSYYFHDEPWMTLFALYALDIGFRIGKGSFIADMFRQALEGKSQEAASRFPYIQQNVEIRVEAVLPSNPHYQQELQDKYNNGYHHPYFDVQNEVILKTSQKRRCQWEGNTCIDGLIAWRQDSETNGIFIEAKYMSDISSHITYSPHRNQLARIIDSILHRMLTTRDGIDVSRINALWFFLLTPEAFKSKQYGGRSIDEKSLHSVQDGTKPRLYNYIMEDYLNWENLSHDLPHWQKHLSPYDWQNLCNHIGWISWEDVVTTVIQHRTLTEPAIKWFAEFFFERGINPHFDDPEAGVEFMMYTDPELRTLVKELGELVNSHE